MSAFFRLLCLLTLFLLPGVQAEEASTPALALAAAKAEAKIDKTAPLMFANRKVFVFRATLAGYAPDERAAGAQRRLAGVLAKHGVLKATTHMIPEGTQVLLDGVQLFVGAARRHQPAGRRQHGKRGHGGRRRTGQGLAGAP